MQIKIFENAEKCRKGGGMRFSMLRLLGLRPWLRRETLGAWGLGSGLLTADLECSTNHFRSPLFGKLSVHVEAGETSSWCTWAQRTRRSGPSPWTDLLVALGSAPCHFLLGELRETKKGTSWKIKGNQGRKLGEERVQHQWKNCHDEEEEKVPRIPRGFWLCSSWSPKHFVFSGLKITVT